MVATSISAAVLAYTPPDSPLEEFMPARDRAFFADPKKESLLDQASVVDEVTPYIGTELEGVQLSTLTDAQKDELALLVAEVRTKQILETKSSWRSGLKPAEGSCIPPGPEYDT
jgi:sulfonate dioxygenase